MVRERSGRWYEPQVAAAFLQIADDDPLWDDLQRDGLAELVRDLDPPELDRVADEAALDRVCEAFADVIDAKSPFTARHSRGVAAYALRSARRSGWRATSCAISAAPACCTTSASSACRTRSSTSRRS